MQTALINECKVHWRDFAADPRVQAGSTHYSRLQVIYLRLQGMQIYAARILESRSVVENLDLSNGVISNSRLKLLRIHHNNHERDK